MESVLEKACARCGVSFPLTPEFFGWSDKRRGSGFDSYCIPCRREYSSLRYAQKQAEKPKREVPVYTERQCSGCKQVKPWTLEYFRPAAQRKRDGVYPVSTYCRECVRADSRRYAKSYVRPKKPKVPKPVKLKQCCDCGGEFPRGPENFAIDAHYCRPCGQLRLERAIEQAKARSSALLTHRTCRHCGETKANTAEFFYPDASNTCKTCWKARTKEYIRQNPLVRRAKNQRRRAREKNAPGRHGAADIRRQFAQQRGLCYWCRGKLETSGDNKFHVDHLIALAKGGSNGPENIVCACPGCNGAKSDKMPWEFAGRLL